MTYVEGFVIAVPTANKDAYRRHAESAVAMFRDAGVARVVDAWGDDIPDGTLTDFRKAVQATDDETVALSWFEYPDKAARDAAKAAIAADPRMPAFGASMPFDAKRVLMAGFETIVDVGGDARGGYVDGIVVPVLPGKKGAYRAMATKVAAVFRDHGALRVVENWGDDLKPGAVTDYRRAVDAGDGEGVVLSWIEWPDKATRDAGWTTVMADARMQPESDPSFDGKRMFWGGFTPLLDHQGE